MGIFRVLLFMPKSSAKLLSAGAPRVMPRLPKVVSQDCANAVSRLAWPLPLPHTSPSLLVRMCVVCGSFSCVGELTLVCGVLAGFLVRYAELVTILNVEPGGQVKLMARFSSGLPGCSIRALSAALSLLPSWVASRL